MGEQAQIKKMTDKMNSEIKQVMHVAPGKSFGANEADENERRWDEEKYRFKNQDSVNHYDITRSHLNFEIGPDGLVHPLGYQEKSLDKRLQDRLLELGWKPFKADSKIQPNCCAKFIFAGNHERTLEMAFGNQKVDLEKDTDNSHLERKKEIELWAKDIYSWCCSRYGKENVIGLQVHLDETSPHCHALIVPVGEKRGRTSVMWSAKFGKNRIEYGNILKEMHTSLYEEVGSHYGLDRGDSIEGRNVMHLEKRDYIRKLKKEMEQAEKAAKALKTMIKNLENDIALKETELKNMSSLIFSGEVALKDYEDKKSDLQKEIGNYQMMLQDKISKLQEKEEALSSLTERYETVSSVIRPFRSCRHDFKAPQITDEIPLFGKDKWLEKQNKKLRIQFKTMLSVIESHYIAEAEKEVNHTQAKQITDYMKLHRLQDEVTELIAVNKEQRATIDELVEVLTSPALAARVLVTFTALVGGADAGVSVGGGGGQESTLRWDGRNPDESDEEYRRRCLMYAVSYAKQKNKRGIRR